MMDSYNYKTYYLGTPKDIEEADSLVLLNSGDFKTISLDSLKDISKELKEKEKLIKTAARGEDGFFALDLEGSIFEFDVILYYNPGSGYTGYTIFSSLQHCYSSARIPFKTIKISLAFNRIQGDGNGRFIKIQNYLDPNIENKKILGSTERWEYTESDKIFFEDNEKNYLKFTNRIPDYLKNSDLCIVTDSGVVSKTSGISGLSILSGVEVDSDFFSFLKPVFYKGDLAILKYSGQTKEYCVSSLSTLNDFKRPYDYVSGVIEEEVPDEILDYNGEIILFQEEEDYLICSLKTSEVFRYPKQIEGIKNHVVIDHWDLFGKTRYMTDQDIKKEVSQSCLVPSDFGYNIYVYRSKFGDWWEFKTTKGYMYTSVYGHIFSNFQIKFVNSRIGMYQSKGMYHFFPIDYGHLYEIKKDFRVLDKTSGSYCDIIIKPSDPMSILTPDIRCFLDGLRRKPIRIPTCFPNGEIIGVGLGMIFYLSDGLLYCY